MSMLSKKQVIERTTLSAVTIWRRIKAGDFPPPRQLTPNKVGWPESTIQEWEDSRPVGIAELPENFRKEPAK